MKLFYIFVFSLSLTGIASAKSVDIISCTLSETNNSTNAKYVRADLNNLSKDGLYTSDGIDIGDENYSFDLSITKEANKPILIDVIFYENIHVQDEVGSYSWELQKKGLSVIQEPLTDENNNIIMNFVCDYE